MTRADCGRVLKIVLLLFSLQFGAAADGASVRKVDAEEARRLVQLALAQSYPHHHIEVLPVRNKYDPNFYYFEANWYGPIQTSPHLGNFAVNAWTGDVFDADGCKQLTSPLLQKRQAAIRKRMRLKAEQYASLREKRPICSVD